MIIYGTALLAACHLIGLFLGDLLGALIGVKSNVGGVGIARVGGERAVGREAAVVDVPPPLPLGHRARFADHAR